MKTDIGEYQRGLLFRHGKFAGYLKPGRHFKLGSGYKVQTLRTDTEFTRQAGPLEAYLNDRDLAEEIEAIDVKDQTLALHFVDGKFTETLNPGKYAFFRIHQTHEFRIVDIADPRVAPDIPVYLFSLMGKIFYTKIEVADFQKARLYFNGELVGLLDPGTHYFWNNGTKVVAGYVDTRLLSLEISGQEMLTLDKVAVRINFSCEYRITDYVKIHTEIDDCEKQIHLLLQLALREYVGKYRLDEILENRDQMSQVMLSFLKGNEADFYVSFLRAGVKDIILPGEIRNIMNTVLVAEKKAQANVITRREEVASTRSLLNTAKLMEENQTLFRLKEMEYIERICENVGSISLTGGTDILAQLAQILRGA